MWYKELNYKILYYRDVYVNYWNVLAGDTDSHYVYQLQGTGGISIYGPSFEDENFACKSLLDF